MKKQDLKTMQVSDYVSSAHPTAVNRKDFGLRVTFAVKYQYWTELVNLLLDRICVYRRANVRPQYHVASPPSKFCSSLYHCNALLKVKALPFLISVTNC